MSEKASPFEPQQPLLVERSDQAINVMHPTGRIINRHTLDTEGEPVVERLYEVRGQQVETINHEKGIPTKFVHESKLTLDAQAAFAEQLHDGSLDQAKKGVGRNIRSINEAPSLRVSEASTSVMVEMPESIRRSLDAEKVRQRRLGMKVLSELIDSEDVPQMSRKDLRD